MSKVGELKPHGEHRVSSPRNAAGIDVQTANCGAGVET